MIQTNNNNGGCPNCGRNLNCVAAVNEHGQPIRDLPQPRVGDVTVCSECMTVLAFSAVEPAWCYRLATEQEQQRVRKAIGSGHAAKIKAARKATIDDFLTMTMSNPDALLKITERPDIFRVGGVMKDRMKGLSPEEAKGTLWQLTNELAQIQSFSPKVGLALLPVIRNLQEHLRDNKISEPVRAILNHYMDVLICVSEYGAIHQGVVLEVLAEHVMAMDAPDGGHA